MDTPGKVKEISSPEFQQYYNEADLLISNGQGNYESLSDVRKPIFFLLRAKCQLVASELQVPFNGIVLAGKNLELLDL